jgi:hypothetical protein
MREYCTSGSVRGAPGNRRPYRGGGSPIKRQKKKMHRLKIKTMPKIVWSDYMKYRAKLRGFSLEKIEEILRYSSERYFDNGTHRMVVVGKHENRLVIIPYDKDGDTIVPVTIHAITRQ